MTKTTIKMTKFKDCNGTVRFDAPKAQPGAVPPPMQNAYVSRSVPGINEAKEITVTIEVP